MARANCGNGEWRMGNGPGPHREGLPGPFSISYFPFPPFVFLWRARHDLLLSQWLAPRPERLVPDQRAHGAAPAADAPDAAVAHRRCPRLDVAPDYRAAGSRPDRALPHASQGLLRRLQSRADRVAPPGVLQRRSG